MWNIKESQTICNIKVSPGTWNIKENPGTWNIKESPTTWKSEEYPASCNIEMCFRYKRILSKFTGIDKYSEDEQVAGGWVGETEQHRELGRKRCIYL